jgi:hypothetical protein
VNGPSQKAYIAIPIPLSRLLLKTNPKTNIPDPLIISQTINKDNTPRQLPIDLTISHIPFQKFAKALHAFFIF